MRLLLLIALVTGDAPKRLQQTTYGLKAAARGGLVIGVEARDGCIICAASSEAKGPSWASLDKGAATEKILKIAPHAAVGVSGLDGDCRSGVKALRNAAVAHWLEFGDRLTLTGLADALADECARHAGLDALLSGSDDDDDDERPARPLGAAFLLAGIDDASSVWLVDAAASPRRWRAKAIGQSSNEADAKLESELRALCARRGFDFPSLNDRAPWSLEDATAIACGVLDALCGEADVAATVVRPAAAVEASTEYDAFTHDDGWEGPSAPVVSALPDGEFRAAVDNLAAQRPTPPGDAEAASIVVRQALDLSEGSVSYEVIHSN
jgi:20S proteasome alpha/beta subunit